MTIQDQAIRKMMEENKLKAYDTIDLGSIGFYLNHGTNIIKHGIVPTLRTKSYVAVVVEKYD